MDPQELDSWQAERNLCVRAAPARQALAGWIIAAILAVAAVVGPPVTQQAIPELLALRADILTLDRELDRVTVNTLARIEGRGGGSSAAAEQGPLREIA
jgi:hypothetical protein